MRERRSSLRITQIERMVHHKLVDHSKHHEQYGHVVGAETHGAQHHEEHGHATGAQKHLIHKHEKSHPGRRRSDRSPK